MLLQYIKIIYKINKKQLYLHLTIKTSDRTLLNNIIRLKKLKNDKKLWKAKNDDVSTLTIKTSLSKPREAKPSIVNQRCVVYYFICDLCDADYVGYTARHHFQRVTEHKNSAIGNHFHEAHGRKDLLNESHFKILRKCQGKFDCLVFEMLFIKKFKPNLNVQTDSIRAKRFV